MSIKHLLDQEELFKINIKLVLTVIDPQFHLFARNPQKLYYFVRPAFCPHSALQ